MAYPRRGRRATQRAAKRMQFRRKRAAKRTQVRNKTSVPVGLGFPKRMVMTHKYTDTFSLTSTTGAFNKHLLNCNGMFDPNTTGVGHQPLYYDQMAALYNHYTVIGSKIRVRLVPNGANSAGFYIGTWLDDDTVTSNITSASDVSERTSGKLVLVPPNANNVFTFYNKWSAKKTFGGSVLGNDNLQGSISANPAESTYFGIGIQSIGSPTTVADMVIEITYIAVWDELKDVAQS